MGIDSVIAAPGTRPDERDLHNCRNRRVVRLQRLSDDGQTKQKLSSVKDRNNGGMRHLCPRDSRKSRVFRGPAGEAIQPDENDRSPSAGHVRHNILTCITSQRSVCHFGTAFRNLYLLWRPSQGWPSSHQTNNFDTTGACELGQSQSPKMITTGQNKPLRRQGEISNGCSKLAQREAS